MAAKVPGEGRTALITGASGGIGAALALAFARDGWDLVLVARSAPGLRRTADAADRIRRTRISVIPLDLADPAAAAKLFETVEFQRLRIDALVNNAGFALSGPLVAVDPGRLLDLLQVNVTTLTHLTRLFLPGLVDRRGFGVLNVASTAAYTPGPGMAAYYASKAFVLSFTEALAVELRGTGVRATALCPGPTATGFSARAGVSGSLLFRGFAMQSADRVAAAGYAGFLRGRRVVVPGLLNRLSVLGMQWSPRGLQMAVVDWLHRPR